MEQVLGLVFLSLFLGRGERAVFPVALALGLGREETRTAEQGSSFLGKWPGGAGQGLGCFASAWEAQLGELTWGPLGDSAAPHRSVGPEPRAPQAQSVPPPDSRYTTAPGYSPRPGGWQLEEATTPATDQAHALEEAQYLDSPVAPGVLVTGTAVGCLANTGWPGAGC